MLWYTKRNLGLVCLVGYKQAKHAEKIEASSARQVQGVIDWPISHPLTRACESQWKWNAAVAGTRESVRCCY